MSLLPRRNPNPSQGQRVRDGFRTGAPGNAYGQTPNARPVRANPPLALQRPQPSGGGAVLAQGIFLNGSTIAGSPGSGVPLPPVTLETDYGGIATYAHYDSAFGGFTFDTDGWYQAAVAIYVDGQAVGESCIIQANTSNGNSNYGGNAFASSEFHGLAANGSPAGCYANLSTQIFPAAAGDFLQFEAYFLDATTTPTIGHNSAVVLTALSGIALS